MTSQLTLFDGLEIEPAPYKRKELDRYDSPYWFATVLLERIPVSGTVIECCVGGGQISEVLRPYRNIDRLYTNDIDRTVKSDFNLDATKEESWAKMPPLIDWVVTNPPYKDGFDIVNRALNKAKKGVAMALRETWLGSSEERLIWLQQNKPTDVISMPRFNFVRDKHRKWNSDSTAVWWIVWQWNLWGQKTNFQFVAQQDIKYFYNNPDRAIDLATVQDYVSTLP